VDCMLFILIDDVTRSGTWESARSLAVWRSEGTLPGRRYSTEVQSRPNSTRPIATGTSRLTSYPTGSACVADL